MNRAGVNTHTLLCYDVLSSTQRVNADTGWPPPASLVQALPTEFNDLQPLRQLQEQINSWSHLLCLGAAVICAPLLTQAVCHEHCQRLHVSLAGALIPAHARLPYLGCVQSSTS
jgi:hypothetical protein